MSKTSIRASATLQAAAVCVAVGLVAAASPAHAALEIELQSDGHTYTQTGGNPLVVQQSIGNFSTSIDTGLASSTPGLDLSSTNLTTSGAGTLVVTLSENNITSPLGLQNWMTQFSGNFFSNGNITVTLQSYLDGSNTLLGTGTALSTLASGHSPLALSANAQAAMTGPYAITEVLTVQALGTSSVTSLDASVTAVPEPASLALLGSALFGFGMIRRRASRAV